MGYSASVVDGKIQDTSAQGNSLSTEKKNNGSTLGKDAFLKLLVAQMKYQDPLEPTSNTEYISQLATFSELEEMQNLTANMSIQRASSLVGQEVILNVTNKVTGANGFIRGKVDFVQLEGNKAYLSIGGALYSIDDLYNVVDREYMDAYDKAVKLMDKLAELPKVDKCNKDNMKEMKEVWEIFDGMSDYEKTFVAQDIQKLIKEYKDKLDELEKLNGSSEPKPEQPLPAATK